MCRDKDSLAQVEEQVLKIFVKDKLSLTETEVEIRCRERDAEVEGIIDSIRSLEETLMGEKENGDKIPVTISKVLYFEAVDRNVFAYTSSDYYRVRRTLYDLEEELVKRHFVRISKALVVNLKAVKKVSPEDGRRLKLLLRNGEWVIVSRNYVSDFKRGIGMKEA
ncbi:LytTr DNA-binding domain-containing protein [Lachnospiraceae bacterium NE2001]|nr:LytTr DNA-binding domain-containing protein [Lachnospiraceae bacterium NE2001]